MRIALAQIISSADPAANLRQIGERVTQAAAQQVDLVVFPEATMRCFGRSLVDVAEPLDGPWATRVRAIAAEAAVVVAVGMFTPADGDRVRNTLLVVGPGVDASYDKIHLFDAFGYAESDTVAPGTDPLVVDVAGVRIGFATCYDVRFPGLFTHLAGAGAEVICVCASWGAGPGKVEQWDLLTRARALDATSFVVACGQADPATTGVELVGTTPTGIGHSTVVSPRGETMASLGGATDLLVVDVDPSELAAVRTAIPVLANRRF